MYEIHKIYSLYKFFLRFKNGPLARKVHVRRNAGPVSHVVATCPHDCSLSIPEKLDAKNAFLEITVEQENVLDILHLLLPLFQLLSHLKS